MPSRGNLVLDCVRVIKLRVESGEWQQLLPGERRLATVLQVGRDTIRLALQELEREGLLGSAEAGSRRRIRSVATNQAASRTLRISLLAHRRLEQLPQPLLLEIDRIRSTLADKGGSLELIAPPWYEQKNPANRLATLLDEEPCSAWILLRSSAAVQEWFMQRRIPCLIRGYPHPGISLPHLDVDWRATARHAAGQLWRLGHRRAAILVPADPLKGVEAAVQGVKDLDEDGFEATTQVEDGSPSGVARVLSRALQVKNPPTAIIATRARQAATALTWLASKGIQVPGHISLITLASEPFLDHLVPEISGYRTDPDAVAKLVTRRLERIVGGDPSPGGSPWISPEVVKGASLARLKPKP